jgi:hypothetical protein
VGVDDSNLLLALGVAFVVAMIADTLVSRFARRAAGVAALATVASVLVWGTISWLGEPAGAHATNPLLSRAVDWFGHVGGYSAMFALPVLVGLGVAALLPRARVPRLLRVAITSLAILVSVPVGIMVMFTIGASIYDDGP